MALKETIKRVRDLLHAITEDLVKAEAGNKAASQRVRTGTIKLEKTAKEYRKESIRSEKTGGTKKTAKKAAPKAKASAKKAAPKAAAKKAAPKAAKAKAKVAPKAKKVVKKAVKAKAHAKAVHKKAHHAKPRALSIKKKSAKLPTKRKAGKK